jgi:hypothetical protein
MNDILRNEFVASIKKFVEHRQKHGGILLPNSIIVADVFDEAMIEAGLYPKRKPKYELNGSVLLPTENNQ